DLIHWLARRDGVVGQGKESWPASADRRGFASRILTPSPRPATFFSRPPDSVRGRGKKCSVPLSLLASRSIGSGHHTSTSCHRLRRTLALVMPCRPLRSRIWNLRSDLQIWVRGRREKYCAGMKA